MREFFEINPHLALCHSESQAAAPCKLERDLKAIEKALGHSLDGELERDGYSLDDTVDMLVDGNDVDDCVAEILARPSYKGARK